MDHSGIARALPSGLDRVLDRVIETMPPADAERVRTWLSDGKGGTDPLSLMRVHAPVGADVQRPDPNDPQAIRHVGVIGGGTAGYLTALALKAKRPWLDVTLVESSKIPIIGVGESTVSFMLMFLHHMLGIDVDELYREVRPTWKLGVNFEWGPHPDGFRLGFDFSSESVGLLGTLAETGNVSGATLGSTLMLEDRVGVFTVDDQPVSLMKYLPFAYHLDNAPFVRFLTNLARERGINHIDATLADVVVSRDEWVDHLRTEDGRELRFDFYIDCTGFRSMLLGKAFGTPYVSYESSLFTDSAVTGTVQHGGHIKPYTDVVTMTAGWNWGIPTQDVDHRGYVYSSAFISDEDAAAEFSAKYPGITDLHVLRFSSGRREKAWRGNVMGIGNSYAFTEPMESTGLVMAADAIWSIVAMLPGSWAHVASRDAVNLGLNQRWDQVRWLIATHYKFNTRYDTAFWKEVHSTTDVSGFQPMLDLYAECAPLSRRDPLIKDLLHRVSPPAMFGLYGIDNLLLGMQVPTRQLLTPAEPIENWRARRAAADVLAARALPLREALDTYAVHPELNHQLLHDIDSWAGPIVAGFLGLQ